MVRIKYVLLLFIISASYTACTEQPQKPAAVLPAIEEFSENIPSISPHSSELKWIVKGATSVRIEPEFGQVDNAGTRLVRTTDRTTYTLTAINKAGTTSKSITIFCPYCEPYGVPKIKGNEKYIDNVNGFGLAYPSSWIIDKLRFSELNSQTGGVLSGVSFSNGKPGSDYSFYDVIIEDKGPYFNKRAFADQYKEQQLLKGYLLVYEQTRQTADDDSVIMQTFSRTSNNRKHDMGVTFTIHAGKLWTEMYEWPHDMSEYNIPYSMELLP